MRNETTGTGLSDDDAAARARAAQPLREDGDGTLRQTPAAVRPQLQAVADDPGRRLQTALASVHGA